MIESVLKELDILVPTLITRLEIWESLLTFLSKNKETKACYEDLLYVFDCLAYIYDAATSATEDEDLKEDFDVTAELLWDMVEKVREQQNKSEDNLDIDYDADGDVLYISLGESRKSYGETVGDCVVIRRNSETKEIVGYTIVGLRKCMDSGILWRELKLAPEGDKIRDIIEKWNKDQIYRVE